MAALDADSISSSPRVRGTPTQRLPRSTAIRFIPACAGNTPRCGRCSGRSTVHPRVCGEHASASPPVAISAGSSPRVRGTRRWPAGVGHTITVHPRVCGEHRCGAVFVPLVSGSSPRVRGTPPARAESRYRSRFIPACAGNTDSYRSVIVNDPVHPRVCGEHIVYATLTDYTTGSSPRVRGTPRPDGLKQLAGRFIPACAGNTRDRTMPGSPETGSSPRVRGTRVGDLAPVAVDRFIPACAGNTALTIALDDGDRGSSPRVRGTHHEVGLGRVGGRFIPACAGNTLRTTR